MEHSCYPKYTDWQECFFFYQIDCKLGNDVSDFGIFSSKLGNDVSDFEIFSCKLGNDVRNLGRIDRKLGNDVSDFGIFSCKLGNDVRNLGRIDSKLGIFSCKFGNDVPMSFSLGLSLCNLVSLCGIVARENWPLRHKNTKFHKVNVETHDLCL